MDKREIEALARMAGVTSKHFKTYYSDLIAATDARRQADGVVPSLTAAYEKHERLRKASKLAEALAAKVAGFQAALTAYFAESGDGLSEANYDLRNTWVADLAPAYDELRREMRAAGYYED